MKPTLLRSFVALAVCLTWAAPAAAQPTPDHLKCYKVKDQQPKTTYTADLGGLVAEPGCTIKVPATMACVPATKTNVMPMPPGGGGSGTPNSFFCYKVKCRKATLPTLPGIDQFGSRSVTPSAAKLLCAPLAGAITTTTATTSSTTTTSTTTTTLQCQVGGPEGGAGCQGSCPPGLFCSLDVHSLTCSCLPGTAPCEANSCGSACPAGETCMVFGSDRGGLLCGCG